MSEVTKVCKPCIEITLEEQTPVVVETTKETASSIVEVQIQGLQGPAAVDRPLEYDPVEIYLKARGDFCNADNS